MAEIQDIIDQLLVVQNAITPPTGLKDVTCYDEPPAGVLTFPVFYNAEDGISAIDRSPSRRVLTYDIGMHLLFARADQKYGVRERRQWVKKVLDAFDKALTLGGNIHLGAIETVDFEPFELGDVSYIAANFQIAAQVDEAFEYVA